MLIEETQNSRYWRKDIMEVTTSVKYDSNSKASIQMPSLVNVARETRNHLGTGLAEKEWNDNPLLANQKFLHIGAYEHFLDEDTLILLGRTGTGKTSILRSIEYNIDAGKCCDYTDVILDNFDNLFDILLRQQEHESESTMMYQMETIIDTTVITMVMVHCVNKYPDSEDLKETRAYLEERGLISLSKPKSLVSKILKSYKAESSNVVTEIYNSVSSIYNIISSELSIPYEKAKKELLGFLENRKFLVMFDSLDNYNIRQKNEVLAVKSLISTCFNYYINNQRTHIYLKIALPSEVHTRILDSLPGKQQGNTVLIQWNYKELISFVALRFYYWSRENKTKKYKLDLSFANEYEYSDFTLDNENAYGNSKNFLKNILPSTCPTCFIFEFDTLSYCLRHTLKKPREILTIYNALLEEIVVQKDVNYFIKKPQEIKNIVHSTQESMIKSALSMYENSFDDINSACFVVLNSLNFVFSLSDIRDRLKEAEAQSNRDYDREEILRVLFESGLVGVVNEVRHVDKTIPPFKSKKPFDFIIANFEYQIKGKIVPTFNDQYVIHPMCYEYYRCFVDSDSMVYPNRFADEDDIIASILKD